MQVICCINSFARVEYAHLIRQLIMQLCNASALLPQHCIVIAPHLKDARDGLDESGNLKFLQLLSTLCLLPVFVAQAQCSVAGECIAGFKEHVGGLISESNSAALSLLLPLHKDKNPVISQTAAAIAVMSVQSVLNSASLSGDTSAALSLIGPTTALPPCIREARVILFGRRLHVTCHQSSKCAPADYAVSCFCKVLLSGRCPSGWQ
jgi:hypothetical protein